MSKWPPEVWISEERVGQKRYVFNRLTENARRYVDPTASVIPSALFSPINKKPEVATLAKRINRLEQLAAGWLSEKEMLVELAFIRALVREAREVMSL